MLTFANALNVQPIQGQEVIAATIAGGSFDNIDAYVQASFKANLIFKVYATVGAVRTLVGQANYIGPTAARLVWAQQTGPFNNPQLPSSLHAGGSSYDLVVFTPDANPPTVNVTLAGANETDVVAPVNTSGAVNLNPNFTEASIVTAAGYAGGADISAIQTLLPGCLFILYASCGAGSVEAAIYSESIAGGDGNAAIAQNLNLPVASQYRLAVRKLAPDNVIGPLCTGSLATYPEGALTGAMVPLAGEVTGPAGATVLSGPFSTASLAWKANVIAPSLGQLIAAAGAGQPMTIQAQNAAVGSNTSGGTLTLSNGASDGGATLPGDVRAFLQVNGTIFRALFRVEDQSNGPAFGTGVDPTFGQSSVWLGNAATQAARTNANAALTGNNINTWLNAATTVFVTIGGAAGGASTNVQLSFSAGGLVQFAPAIANPTITQTVATAGAGQPMLIQAQNAHAGSGAAGGQLTLKSGANDPAGQTSDIRILSTQMFFDAAGAVILGLGPSISPFVASMNWNSGVVAPTIFQDAPGANANGQNFTLAPQAGGATSGIPGSLIVNIAAPNGGSADGYFRYQRNAIDYLLLGPLVGNPTTFWAIYSGGVVPSAINFTLGAARDGSNVSFNAGTVFGFDIGGNPAMTIVAATITVNPPSFQWSAGVVAPTINQAQNTIGAGQPLTIHAQDAKVGSATAGGDLQLQVGTGDAIHGTLGFFFGGSAVANRVYRFDGTGQLTLLAGATFKIAQDVNAVGAGNPMSITGQAAKAASNANGGTMTVVGGVGDGTGNGGGITLRGGAAGGVGASIDGPVTIGSAKAAIGMIGNLAYTQRTVAVNTTIDSPNFDFMIWCTAALTLTLPAPRAGALYCIVVDSAAGIVVTLARHAAELINGAGANLAYTAGTFVVHWVTSDGTNWVTFPV